jgi:hypothetical protein
MDNLIRAQTFQPFVQLSYRNILLQEANTYVGDLTNALTRDDTNVINVPHPVTGMLTRHFMNLFTVHGGAQRAGLISYYAEPVTDQNDIYEAYLKYAQDPDLFMVSDTKPACPVHIMKKSCGKYYFVPVEAAPEFQKLVMATTFMRGRDAAPPPGYVSAKIVEATLGPPSGRGKVINVTLKFDQTVPSGDCIMTFNLAQGCRSVRLNLFPPAPPAKQLRRGTPTDTFDTQWNPENPETAFQPAGLIGKSVRIYSHDFPPDVPEPPQGKVQEVRDVLDRIRAFQTSPGTLPLAR